MKIVMYSMFALAMPVALFGEVVQWNSADKPEQLGSLSFVYDGDAVETVSSPGGEVTIVGDPIAFANEATVSLSGAGCLTFANDVTSGGLIACTRTGAEETWEGELPLTETGTTVFSGVTLDELDVVSCQFGGGLTGLAKPYFANRSAGRLEVQMQSLYLLSDYNAGQTQAAKLVLVQDGADIKASLVWAKTYGTTYGDYRGKVDFSTEDVGQAAESSTVVSLTLVRTAAIGRSTVAFTGKCAADLSVRGGLVVKLDGPAAAEGGQLSQSVETKPGSKVVFQNADGLTLVGAITGGGDVAFARDDEIPVSYFREGFFYTAADMDSDYHTTSVLFRAQADLSCVTGLTAKVGCYSKGVLPIATGGYVLVSKTGSSQKWQIQGLDKSTSANFMRCAELEFTQVGSDVYCKYVAARQGKDGTQGSYYEGSLQKVTASTADSGNTAAVYVYDVCLLGARTDPVPVQLQVTNAMSGGTYEIGSNAVVSIDRKESLPGGGQVHVNGEARMNFAMNEQATTYRANTASFHIHPGGVLRQAQRFSVGYMFFIWNDGGRYLVDRTVDKTGFDAHVNHLSFSNGASFESGAAVYAGKLHSGNWRVCGTTPSSASVNLMLYGGNGSTESNPKALTFMLDVDDVDGGSGVDFSFSGGITTPQNAAWTNVTFVKAGAGTMRLDGPIACAGGVQIYGGSLLLGTGNATTSAQSFLLKQSELAFASGTTNTVGSMTVNWPGGSLKVPDGASLTIDTLTLQTPQTVLNLTGDLTDGGRQVRVLNVSAEDRKKIVYNGKGVLVDEDGWLIPRGSRGFVFIMR